MISLGMHFVFSLLFSFLKISFFFFFFEKKTCLQMAIWSSRVRIWCSTVLLCFIKVRMGPGPKLPVGKEIPVIWTIFPGFNGQGGPNRRAAMAEHGPVDEQEVRQVCSDRHETCTLLFRLFEIYNLED